MSASRMSGEGDRITDDRIEVLSHCRADKFLEHIYQKEVFGICEQKAGYSNVKYLANARAQAVRIG